MMFEGGKKGEPAWVSFLVGLVKKLRALVYLVGHSSSRAICFSKKDTYACGSVIFVSP